MTLRDAFAQTRDAKGTGWLLVRWGSHEPCTLDTGAQFRDVAMEPGAKEPCLPRALAAAHWTAICDSGGLQAVIQRTDELRGKSDDAACLEAMLWYYLSKDLVEDPAEHAAHLAAVRRRRIAEPGAAAHGGPARPSGKSGVTAGPPSVS